MLGSLSAGALLAGDPAPSIRVWLNNNPKVVAIWHSPISSDIVDVGNTPGVMVNGNGFRNGHEPIAVYLAKQLVAKGDVAVASGTFSALLPLAAPLAEPLSLEVRVGGAFSQTIQVKLNRFRGTIKGRKGAAVPFPLVTNGLFRRSAFYVTAVGDKNGKFEILVPEMVSSVSIYENNTFKTQMECRRYAADQNSGPGLEVCMESHLAYIP